MIVATFAFTGSTHAQQAAPPIPPPPSTAPIPPLPGSPIYSIHPAPSTLKEVGPEPPVPGGGSVGAAIRAGKPIPDAPTTQTCSGVGYTCWFYQLLAYQTSQPTIAVYGDFYAFSASKLPSMDSAAGRESYFVTSALNPLSPTQLQIGYDEHADGKLYVFIFESDPNSYMTCSGINNVYYWANANGSGTGYMGCEQLATGLGSTGFDSWSWGEMYDNTNQLQFWWGAGTTTTELGYWSDGNAPGMNTQFFESEIGDTNGDGRTGETMTKLLSDGLKYYDYYGGMWWVGNGVWNQFKTPFTAYQYQFDLPQTYTPEQYNPYCPPHNPTTIFGQAVNVQYTGTYADMMQNTTCVGFNKPMK